MNDRKTGPVGRARLGRRRLLQAGLAAAGLAPLLRVGPARAHSYTLGSIEIGHLWARPAEAGDAPIFGIFLNIGQHADRLVKASSPAADAVKFAVDRNGKAVPLEAIDLLPGKPVPLATWKQYPFFSGLHQPLTLGKMVPLDLEFARAGTAHVEVLIENEPSD